MTIQTIAVVGAGAWGTALAVVAREAGRSVTIVARDAGIAAAINDDHRNPRYLPDVTLDPAIGATTDAGAVAAAEAVLLVTPAQTTRAVVATLAPYLRAGVPLVICAKGFEQPAGRLLSEVVAEAAPRAVPAVLSGPTFAAEVAGRLPTAVTLACGDAAQAEALRQALRAPAFRPYDSPDIVGAQTGGAVKNVIAIASGIVAGRRLGGNARAALMTRGLAEVARLSEALGGDARTPMGLSGLGDLALTCTSPMSRNYALGRALGEGQRLEALVGAGHDLAEGYYSAPAVLARANALRVEMPICAAVHAVLYDGAAIDVTIQELLARPLRRESN